MECLEVLEGTWEELAAHAEAMYLVHRVGGWPLQQNLWTYVEEVVLRLHSPTEAEQKRMRQLMGQYHDTPMDLADASLVATAETLSLTRIFTLDSDFHVYRLKDNDAFEVIP
jgi:predicted nucleic acid-binding protein